MPKLMFLHTNDIHGRFEALARMATLAQRERADAEADGRTVFQFDAGDAFDRRFEQTRLSRGAILPPVLTAAGVELQVNGNDIGLVYGMPAMTTMAKAAAYPILGANMLHQDGTLVDGVLASVLLDGPDGLSIGVVGATAPWDGMYGFFGLAVPDELEVIRTEAASLRQRGADTIVLLSHLGTNGDKQVAREVEDVDLIIGGHFHELFPEGIEENGVPIVQAGNYAEHLGRLDVDLDATGKVTSWQARVIPDSPDIPPSPAVVAAMEQVQIQVAALRDQPRGTLDAALPLDHYGDSPLANFVADFLRERVGAEIGMVGSGSFHGPLPAGTVTHGDLATAFLVPVFPVTSTLTGSSLRRALERSLDPDIVQTKAHGLRGTPYGVLGLSGITVTIDPAAPVGERATSVVVNGEPLDDGRTYRLAHTDLDCQPDTYLAVNDLTVEEEGNVLVEDHIRDHFLSHDLVETRPGAAWKGIENLIDLRPRG